MAVIFEIIDLVVCREIHGCGCYIRSRAPEKYTQVTINSKHDLNSLRSQDYSV